MNTQREYLCVKHNFFPQHPKILNCLTNNALKPGRNKGRCIHLEDINRMSSEKLKSIRQDVVSYLKGGKYKKEHGVLSINEKKSVIYHIDWLLEKRAAESRKRNNNSIA